MKILEAMEIVYDLATQYRITDLNCNNTLKVRFRQDIALDTVHDFIVNVLSE